MSRSERVLIVGGGIGGLATAVGLKRIGYQPTIVERASVFGAAGAGILLHTNSMWALGELGIADPVLEASLKLSVGEVTNAKGKVLSKANFGDLVDRFGPTVAIHRQKLHEVLLDQCRDLELIAGTTVEDLAQSTNQVTVALSNGEEKEFDWVIGADGINSKTRTQAGGGGEEAYAGYLCWRFVVERPQGIDRMQEMWGRGRRFGLVPLPDRKLYCFACINHDQGTSDPPDQRFDRVMEEFAGFGGHAPAALAQLDRSSTIISNEIYDLPKIAWRRRRVLLIGDAAHATTPNMGQGAGMALEDAAVLTQMLGAGGDWSPILDAFVARREPRVRKIVIQSRLIGRVGQEKGPLSSRTRDAVMWATPSGLAHIVAVKAASIEV